MLKLKFQKSRTLLGFGAACQHAADTTNQLSPDFVRQILERLDMDEQELKDLRSQLANPASPRPLRQPLPPPYQMLNGNNASKPTKRTSPTRSSRRHLVC
jgi:hypothetical protein